MALKYSLLVYNMKRVDVRRLRRGFVIRPTYRVVYLTFSVSAVYLRLNLETAEPITIEHKGHVHYQSNRHCSVLDVFTA